MIIEIANRQRLAPLDRKTLRALCEAVLRQHGADAGVSLCYVDNASIRGLNARFLQRDEVTDVLAFPLDDEAAPEGPRLLGEIVVSVEKAIGEARERGLEVGSEIALYTVHGLLHLLGYDDHTPGETQTMRQAEQDALAAAGLL